MQVPTGNLPLPCASNTLVQSDIIQRSHAPHDRFLFERAIAWVDPEAVGLRVIGDKKSGQASPVKSAQMSPERVRSWPNPDFQVTSSKRTARV